MYFFLPSEITHKVIRSNRMTEIKHTVVLLYLRILRPSNRLCFEFAREFVMTNRAKEKQHLRIEDPCGACSQSAEV